MVAVVMVAASCVIAGAHAFSRSQRWEHVPVTADVSPDRLFDWRDALVLVPFRVSLYEKRYPIRLLDPGQESTLSSAEVTLEWNLGDHVGSSCVVDVSFYRLPPGLRIDLVTLEARAPGHLELDRSALPQDLDHGKPVAWRVRAVDGLGQTRAQSAWRRFTWRPSTASHAMHPASSPRLPEHETVPARPTG
jgi:hypothetical protein